MISFAHGIGESTEVHSSGSGKLLIVVVVAAAIAGLTLWLGLLLIQKRVPDEVAEVSQDEESEDER